MIPDNKQRILQSLACTKFKVLRKRHLDGKSTNVWPQSILLRHRGEQGYEKAKVKDEAVEAKDGKPKQRISVNCMIEGEVGAHVNCS